MTSNENEVSIAHDDNSDDFGQSSDEATPSENRMTLELRVESILEGEGFQHQAAKALANLRALLSWDRVSTSLIRGLAVIEKGKILKEQVERAATPILKNLCEKLGDEFVRARVATEVARVFTGRVPSESDLETEVVKALDRLSGAGEAFLDAMVDGLVSTIAGGMEMEARGAEEQRRLSGENKHLKNEVERLRAMANERAEMIERLKKDYENLKKRTAEREKVFQRDASEKIAAHLLPVLDGYDRALAVCSCADNAIMAYLDGFGTIRGQFSEILSRNGVLKMDCIGQLFDPELHEAIFHKPDPEFPDGTIVEVMEAGYMINDKVLRHARVVVAKKME